MKKILLLMIVTVALLSLNVNAQPGKGLYARGGYSWINGVFGGEYFLDNASIGFGWMPNNKPLSGTKINSTCGQFSWYGAKTTESAAYASIGFATNGYQYEDSNGKYG